ncbi:unnamed protein product [Microthlaspi erraticum]|uniref:Homeobox domain-containing protein n=1 Tax=Microthlaspi erraticum TaxID=1685480 RepID=A0A6D2KDX7_9BRAS|nr:unnamed protein product [Microthlaspi erraticum]
MEPLQHHHHHHQADQESGNNNNKSGSGGYTCRQTSTRWTPTTEQIRILKDLYYNNGVRSPTADQIQKISATLRQYGKIEGKNVFYWFQNHKARERQKKRFNGTTMTTTPTSSSPNAVMMATDHYHHNRHHPLLHHHHHHHHGVSMQRPASVSVKLDQENHLLHQNRSYSSFNNGTEFGAVNASNGYMSSHAYGSMAMEQDCSMSYNNVGGGWTNITDHNHHYSAPIYNFFDRPKPLFGLEGSHEDEEYGGDAYLEYRRTLPLFPMHGEDHINGGGGAIWKYGQSDGRDLYGRGPRGPCASLELSLT